MSDPYTQPEMGVERTLCKAIRDAVKEQGGCAYCKQRAHLFETIGRRALCGLTPPRAFPACVEEPGCFEFDEAAFNGRAQE